MDEGHERAFGARPRLVVHEPDAARLQLRQRGADVGDAQRNVVEARTAPLDVLRDRRIGGGRLEQLDRRLTGRNEVRPDALRIDLLGHLHLETERVVKERERFPEVLDGDADVVEDGFHVSSPAGPRRLVPSSAEPALRTSAAPPSSAEPALRTSAAPPPSAEPALRTSAGPPRLAPSSADHALRTRFMMSAAAEYGSISRAAMPSTMRCSSPAGSVSSTSCMKRCESRSRSRYSWR